MKAVDESRAEKTQDAVLGDDVSPQRLTVVPATLVKGLEYDDVVVVEPAEIVETEDHNWQGLRRLSVALTRAVSGPLWFTSGPAR